MRVRYYVPSGCGFMPWRSDNLAEALAEAKRRAVASGLPWSVHDKRKPWTRDHIVVSPKGSI